MIPASVSRRFEGWPGQVDATGVRNGVIVGEKSGVGHWAVAAERRRTAFFRPKLRLERESSRTQLYGLLVRRAWRKW